MDRDMFMQGLFCLNLAVFCVAAALCRRPDGQPWKPGDSVEKFMASRNWPPIFVVMAASVMASAGIYCIADAFH